VSEIVRSALRLLQETEARRCGFNFMVREAEGESDRDGSVAVESVVAEIDQIMATAKR
jgi:Arc/MetJ-type ribon-helix-helix transcriptional regulator